MTLITTTSELAAFCERHRGAAFLTVDTEFLRERTYWPVLCLVQVAAEDEAVAIDPLADGIDLAPLWALMADPDVLKVFHAARQDIEIIHHLSGTMPGPIFDTQVAAMVCGFGESVGYETLVNRLAGARLDKSSRFTDWANRPLTERQLTYALSDVTHLRVVYQKLAHQLDQTGRAAWLDEEMAVLTDPATYRVEPDEAWRRLKIRGAKPRTLAVLREVAAWREREAQRRDAPRNHVVRDEALLEIAFHLPKTTDDLARVRGLGRSFAEGRLGTELLAAVERGRAVPDNECPRLEERPDIPSGVGPVVELMRVLLKQRAEDHGVAARLIANASDLEAIAMDDGASVPALSGWRREIFGDDALALKHGRIALAVARRGVRMIRIEDTTDSAPPVG